MRAAKHDPEARELIPTRRSLLSRLKDLGDQEAWRTFFDTYWKLIYNAAIRAGLNDAEAQDVVQETVIAVSKNIPGFVYDPSKGSFKAWLLRQTSWRITGQRRKRLPVPAAGPGPETPESQKLEEMPDPEPGLEALWNQEWENTLLDAALSKVRARVDAKNLQIYDLCVRQEWPASKVARDLKVSTARVYLAKHRVGNMLKEELLQLKAHPAALGTKPLRSV